MKKQALFFVALTSLCTSVFSTDGLHRQKIMGTKKFTRDGNTVSEKNPFCSTIPDNVKSALEKRWVDSNRHTGLADAEVSPRSVNQGELSRDLHLAMGAADQVYDNHRFLMNVHGRKDGLLGSVLEINENTIPWAGLTAPPGYETVALWYDDTPNKDLTTVDFPTKMFAVKYAPIDRESDLPNIVSIQGTINKEQWKGNFLGAGYPNSLGLARNAKSYFRYPPSPTMQTIIESGHPPAMTGGMFFSEVAQDTALGKRTIFAGHSLGGIVERYIATIIPAEAGRLHSIYDSEDPMPSISFYDFNSGSTGGPGVKGMNGRLGITADETLSKIDKLNLRERRTREFRKDRELFRSVFSDHYKIEEIAQNRQANLRQKKISFGDPNNTVLSAAVLPRASSFGSYTERSNGSGPVKDIPSLNMLRIALKTDPLTRFGNPMLGNYFKGENIVLPVIHESLREMDKKYSTISAEKILQVSLNPGDTAAEIIRNGLKKAKETVDYHSMDALQTYTEEDYLRLGIEIYTELAVNLQSALVPGTSQSIREKIQSDLDRLALEKSEMQRAYYALYCM